MSRSIPIRVVALAAALAPAACSDNGENDTGDGGESESTGGEPGGDEETPGDAGVTDAGADTGEAGETADTGTSGTSETGATTGAVEECNADLRGAPDPVEVEAGLATPIDIKSVDVAYTFELDIWRASASAIVHFEIGDVPGMPILDLRQEVFAVELDGEMLELDAFPYQDFGGGDGTYMRIVERELEPCTDHVLRVAYFVGSPEGSGAEVDWDADGVLFRSSFSDLAPGRFAEQWMPANLIYDRAALSMELEIVGDAAPHVLIANGDVEDVASQVWRVEYPEYFTAQSPLFVLTPDSSIVDMQTRVVSLPDGDVSIEAYFRSGEVDRTLDTLAAGLLTFSEMYGPYAHGDRFLAYMREGNGGMEYAGATDTGDNPDTVSHELFHSWFARGVRPITATDGWWDEAWTSYNTGGETFDAIEALPLDYPGVPLYDPNPWVRHTDGEAYGYGAQIFASIREVIGQDLLIELMGQFYRDNELDVASTDQLEQLLYCNGGEESDVRHIFHRLVHGLPDEAPAPPADYCG